MRSVSSFLWALTLSLAWASALWAQSDSGRQASGSDRPASEEHTPPAPAGGDQPAPQPASQSPLSGLNEASLGPNFASRSYLVSTLQASEGVDSNASGDLNHSGGNAFVGSTFLGGLFGLQRLWHRYQLAIDYRGEGALYSGHAFANAQMHIIDLDWRILWRTGLLQVRDSASYLPEGAFGEGVYGGVAGIGGLGNGVMGGTTVGGGLNFFGYGTFGALGIVPQVSNLSIIDLEQSLGRRSTATLAAGFNLVHFTQDNQGLLIDSRQVTAQAGYNYQLSPTNMLAAVYGFQEVHFPTIGGSSDTQVVLLLFGHQIAERMQLILGAGPQLTEFSFPGLEASSMLSTSARASLNYRFPKTAVSISYNRFNNPGSGFYAGARTDVAYLNVSRPIARQWEALADLGYSHNHPLLLGSGGTQADAYSYGYAGVRVTRTFTRSLNAFFFYQYNDLNFGSGFCATAGNCSHLSSRHVAGIGLTWRPGPIRLD